MSGVDVATLHSAFVESITIFLDPTKRVYWLYLLSAALLACLLTAYRKRSISKLVKQSLSPSLWLHPSSKHDFQWLIFNGMVRLIFIVPVVGSSLALAIYLYRALVECFGAGNFFNLPDWAMLTLFTATVFITEDGSRYLVHRLFHKVPFLWKFHAIHHSAEVLTPITLYRIHWIEMIVSSFRGFLVLGAISGIFMYLFDNSLGIVDVLGVNLFSFLFNLAGANLRHSSIWLGFGHFEKWFISPAQHQIHHSQDKAHYDKNFGAALAIWDRIFDTLLLSQGNHVTSFGLNSERKTAHQSFFKNFLYQQYLPISRECSENNVNISN